MSENYTIARGSEQFGPYTRTQIDEYLAAGTLQPTDLAWTDGQTDWIPLSQLVAAGAPPPPPAAALPGAPPPGVMPGAPPPADAGTKNIVVWVVRGVLIFILLALVGIYFLKDRPAKNEMLEKYEQIDKYNGGIIDMAKLEEETGKKPTLGEAENEEGETVKTATYTWKGFLLNYKIVVEYEDSDSERNTILIESIATE